MIAARMNLGLRAMVRAVGLSVGGNRLMPSRKRNAARLARILLAALITLSSNAQGWSQTNARPRISNRLTFKTSIDLDSAAHNLALAPDGSAIAFLTGKLEIRVAKIDRSAPDIILAHREPHPVIVW